MNNIKSAAIIVSKLNPGGMERVVVILAKGLALKGIKTIVISIEDPGELSLEFIDSGVEYIALNSHKSFDLKSLIKLGIILNRFNPSIINVHDYSAAAYAGLSNLLFTRVPLIFTAHGLLYEGFETLRKRLFFISKTFSKITAVSPKVAKRHKEYLSYKKKIKIIPNGVPEILITKEKSDELKKRFNIDDSSFVFISVGNPRPEKDYETLIHAASFLRGKNKNFKIIIAGKLKNNSYCNDLKKLIYEKELEETIYTTGFIKDTSKVYSAADCFVLSSISEGMPMVILEAMMSGLPVISTSVGGIPEVLKDRGYLVPSLDPVKLSKAMNYVISNRNDAQSLGIKAKEFAIKYYSSLNMIENYLNFFNETISKKN